MKQERIMFAGKWLGIKEISYRESSIEIIYRPYSESKGLEVQGVQIIPIIKYSDRAPQLVIIAVYRPPINSYSLEFPSGMAESTDIKACALRELKQQTGFCADRILDVSPLLQLDTKKSNQNQHIVVALIDGDTHGQPVQNLEYGEHIIMHRVCLDKNMVEAILALQQKHGYQIEGKLWMAALGLALHSIL